MVNKTLFAGKSKLVKNEAGGVGYEYNDKHQLSQIACSGTFNGVYYATAEQTLDKIKELVGRLKNNPKFIAQVAIYARTNGYMKDMPAYLVAVLATLNEPELFRSTFDKVIDNGKMLRNFVKIGRSGEAGKVINMSSGTVRKAINNWFATRTSDNIFRASIGNDPTMKDILCMARPKPENEEKATLYGYLMKKQLLKNTPGKENKEDYIYQHDFKDLPELVKNFETFKINHEGEIPNLDFRMLDAILTPEEMKKVWEKQVNAGWHLVKMNLNNFQKYGIFNSKDNVQKVVQKLTSKEEIKKSKVFPYQLLVAYKNTTTIPHEVKEALQDAMEISVDNVPVFEGRGFVCVDTSGSMQSPITGNGLVPSQVRCVDVAGLFAASVMRKNKSVEVVPFDTAVRHVELNPRDSVMSNAQKLALSGGGTDCGCAIKYLNDNSKVGDYIVFISDDESWRGIQNTYRTGMLQEWQKFKARNPNAKLICIDIQPYTTAQVNAGEGILQVGGFNDYCWSIVEDFIKSGNNPNFWIQKIEEIAI